MSIAPEEFKKAIDHVKGGAETFSRLHAICPYTEISEDGNVLMPVTSQSDDKYKKANDPWVITQLSDAVAAYLTEKFNRPLVVDSYLTPESGTMEMIHAGGDASTFTPVIKPVRYKFTCSQKGGEILVVAKTEEKAKGWKFYLIWVFFLFLAWLIGRATSR